MAGVVLDITSGSGPNSDCRGVATRGHRTLAAAIAHDLNNMLVAILGFSDLLADSLQRKIRRADVEQITAAATRSANLTRQLLAFARRELISLGRSTLAPSSALEGIAAIRAGRKHRSGAGALGRRRLGVCHPGQIEQILMNLVLNARRAMPKGGRLVVETARLTLGPAYESGSATPTRSGRYMMLA